ncbi:MAG: hypothetical protein RMY29_009120 [Nostoc sp. CreGUA01]|nr:hypothetical protein [Nostoc sp. CreGUA01]
MGGKKNYFLPDLATSPPPHLPTSSSPSSPHLPISPSPIPILINNSVARRLLLA